MIDFSRTYISHWRVVKVDEYTWDDGEEMPGVTSVSINKDGTDSVPLLETLSMEVSRWGDMQEFEEGWYRVNLDVEQNGRFERYPLATSLLQKADESVTHSVTTSSVSGSSVLKPLEDRKNIGTDYAYAPKGANGPNWVRDIIASTSPAPVRVVGNGFKLSNNILFTPGISYLEMVWSVLDAGKWVLMIDGDGSIAIVERPKTASMDLTSANARYISESFSRSLDYSGVCNRYYAIDRDGSMEIAKNENPNSVLSYNRRGRWVDYVDTSPNKVNGETLYSYARRRLEEESTLVRTYKYDREYWPGVVPFSLISASLPSKGIEGDLRVLSQEIACDKGIVVSETAGIEIKEWKA